MAFLVCPERVDVPIFRRMCYRCSDTHNTPLTRATPPPSSLESQLSSLTASIEQQVQQQAQMRQQMTELEEADKALGRSGIQSFVLEGVLGELQARWGGGEGGGEVGGEGRGSR